MTRRNVSLIAGAARVARADLRAGDRADDQLYVLGSGSRGNCFAVESDGVAILLDAGFSAREIERRAEAAGLELGLRRRHRAHPRAWRPRLRRAAPGAPARRAGADGAGHLETGSRPDGRRPSIARIGLCGAARAGPFRVEACPTSHDAAEPLAIVVARPATAPASGWPTTWAGRPPRCATCCGTSRAWCSRPTTTRSQLRTSGYPPVVQRRIAGSGGHLSNRAAAELLAELHHPGLCGGGAGASEPALQHGRRRSRDGRRRRSAGPASAARCTWPRRTRRCRRSRWRCR